MRRYQIMYRSGDGDYQTIWDETYNTKFFARERVRRYMADGFPEDTTPMRDETFFAIYDSKKKRFFL